jgi:hypothetical protein
MNGAAPAMAPLAFNLVFFTSSAVSDISFCQGLARAAAKSDRSGRFAPLY